MYFMWHIINLMTVSPPYYVIFITATCITSMQHVILCNTKPLQKGFTKYWEFIKVKIIFEYFIWLTRPLKKSS